MKVTSSFDGHEASLTVVGDIDSETSLALQTEIDHVLERGAQSLVFHFAGVTFLSSAGLSVLIDAQQKVAGQLQVRRGNRIVDRLFVLVGLSSLYGDDKSQPD
jgi:anti-sigma B factor antagonist